MSTPTPRWHQLAACRGMDPELFFPGRGESLTEARAVCAACPVRTECLREALDNGEKWGVWGGVSEHERRPIRQARRRRTT